MFKASKVVFLFSALLAGASLSQVASASMVEDQSIAREAGEGARGEGGKKGGHAAIEVNDQFARETSEGARGEGGKKGGHAALEVSYQLA